MFEPLQRALDLTARFDYEYWLGSEIRKNLKFFPIPADNENLRRAGQPRRRRRTIRNSAKIAQNRNRHHARAQNRQSLPRTSQIKFPAAVRVIRCPLKFRGEQFFRFVRRFPVFDRIIGIGFHLQNIFELFFRVRFAVNREIRFR